MKRLLSWVRNSRNVILVGLGVAVPIAFLAFFQFTQTAINDEKLAEKIVENEDKVNIISNDIRYDADHLSKEAWAANRDYLTRKIKVDVEDIDKKYDVYARLFKGQDLEVLSDSYQTFDAAFDPLADEGFYNAVREHFGVYGSYSYTVHFDGGEHKEGHDIYLRYRWVPVVDWIPDPYLIVIGVGKYSLQTTTQGDLTTGFVLFGIYVVGITYAYLFRTRKGEKK